MTMAETKTRRATILGVALALGVPLLGLPTGMLSELARRFGPTGSVEGTLAREGFFWILTALVVLVLVIGERLPPSAIGLKRPRWSTLLWGVAGFVAIYLCEPLGAFLLNSVGGKVPQQTIAGFTALPIWLLFLIVLRAGVCEEILFRGYGIERLTALTGSRIIGAVAPGLIFMVGHMQAFGPRYLLFILPTTVVLTALYLWRRDLIANMIAHFLTDAVGLGAAYAATHGLVPQSAPGS